jgi:hypothetical protein
VSSLAQIITQYGPAYRAKYEARMPYRHLKAMRAIERCRTEALGGHVYHCQSCQLSQYKYHSCRNRACPQCQGQAGQRWLEKQQQLLLAAPYFMVTFTLPEPLRRLARRRPKALYNLLFRSAAAALQELAGDPRFVGGQIGMVGLLHTWGRDLSYHPHVHFLVPGGGLSTDGQQWRPSRRGFLVHVRPLGQLFRAKFEAGLERLKLEAEVSPALWRQDWVVHSQPVGDGQAALNYLAPYIFRVAISNHRIIDVAEGQVTFWYTPSGQKKRKRCTLAAEEFIRRFLQHVLPPGFVKVRYYGLFAPGQRSRLAQARALLGQAPEMTDPEPESPSAELLPPAEPQAHLCPQCGRPMECRSVAPGPMKPP